MLRMKAVIAYDGTNFSGYQIQPHLRTVQGEVQRALKKMHKGQSIRVHASGRTDTGAHALGQVIHFDTPIVIAERNWIRALHALLPGDISLYDIKAVSSTFHSRYDASSKEYDYRLLTNEQWDVFRRHVTYHVPQTLHMDAMEEALSFVVGTHDFTSFSATNPAVTNKVRTMLEASLFRSNDELIFRFVGTGFLHKMIRSIVGTVLEVGKKRRSPSEMKSILKARSRQSAGKTAPAHGLFLRAVHYDQ